MCCRFWLMKGDVRQTQQKPPHQSRLVKALSALVSIDSRVILKQRRMPTVKRPIHIANKQVIREEKK
jgi:hypothetical protein